MSGGHWGYLRSQLEDRAGQPLNEVWRLLAAIEKELDYGLCGDTCYECARIRTINALEVYFDTEATSIEEGMRILKSSEPECERCKNRQPIKQAESVTVQLLIDGKMYRGGLRESDS